MEIRRSKRVIVSLEAELMLDGARSTGFIGNVSEDGIFMRMHPPEEAVDLEPGLPVELKFHIPSGDIINLCCTIKWVIRILPESLIYNIGLSIDTCPQKYREFLAGRVEF